MGRGSSGVKSNVVYAANRFGGSKPEESKWDFRSVRGSVEKIETAVDGARNARQAQAAYRAIGEQETVIAKALEDLKNGNDTGDEKALMTYRRRLRQAKKRLIERGVI